MSRLEVTILVAVLVVGYIAQIRLWDENIWRRIYVHQSNNTYRRDLIPFVRKFTPSAPVARAYELISPHCCTLKTSALSRRYGAFDADHRGGALYYNHLQHLLTRSELCELAGIRDEMIREASALVGKPLHAFSSSMWNVFYLAYTGTHGKFGWHYDSERATDYRILVCVDATDGAGAVEYIDETGVTRALTLAPGEAYILRGSQTFHRVRPNKSDNDRRIMIGFHCSEEARRTTHNLCYFGNLTGWGVRSAFRVWRNQDVYRDVLVTPSSNMCRLVYH